MAGDRSCERRRKDENRRGLAGVGPDKARSSPTARRRGKTLQRMCRANFMACLLVSPCKKGLTRRETCMLLLRPVLVMELVEFGERHCLKRPRTTRFGGRRATLIPFWAGLATYVANRVLSTNHHNSPLQETTRQANKQRKPGPSAAEICLQDASRAGHHRSPLPSVSTFGQVHLNTHQIQSSIRIHQLRTIRSTRHGRNDSITPCKPPQRTDESS